MVKTLASIAHKDLNAIARTAIKCFKKETECIFKSNYDEKLRDIDNGKGCIYAYFNRKDKPLYIGETGRHAKARWYDKTSPHKRTQWWKHWHYMRLMPESHPNRRHRIEFLLILGYKTKYNKKPSGEW